MALASIPGSTTEGSTGPVDAYLLEFYRQAAESARPAADPRFSSTRSFLTFVGLVTAALAVPFAVSEGSSGSLLPAASVALGIIGMVVSIGFYALELRRDRAVSRETRFDGSTYTTSSIYQASIGFFAFGIIIGAALLLVR